jgi:hypothetical protein
MYLRRYMDPMYRRTLVLQEVLGYHADIICLQEVDEKAFQHYLLPHLNFAGVVPLIDYISVVHHRFLGRFCGGVGVTGMSGSCQKLCPGSVPIHGPRITMVSYF